MIGFIDADSLALKNPDASLLQPNTTFMGVGRRHHTGRILCIEAISPTMEAMIGNIVRTVWYRIRRNVFLNLYFGSSYNFNKVMLNRRLKIYFVW